MKKQLKLWHGILLVVLTGIIIFKVEEYLAKWFGLYGTLISELIILGLAVGITLIFHGDLRTVFPIRKPKVSEVFGTLLFWFGTYLFAMMCTIIMTYFFTEEVAGINQGLGEAFTSVSFIAAFLIVSISPAICEESVFRGAFFNSLWNTVHKKWIVILVTAAIFGAFHGSVFRFVPTFILGIAMGYIVFETNNMFCNMLFHAVNNAVPTVLLFVIQYFSRVSGSSSLSEMTDSMIESGVPLFTVGLYMFYGCVGIVIVYLANNLLHHAQPGVDHRLFPPQKKRELIVIGVICACLVVAGIVLIMVSVMSGELQWILELSA